ncbi:MAG: hypothetical protein LUQ28_13990 [Methylococcaceae bacterium]|nr:hypothetical protein [Methylococcaceae bacterium]
MAELINKGDSITAMGLTFKVDKILYQCYLMGYWDVEFLDPQGGYHHWKQEEDGGRVIYK